jgi:ubiquinone/menaquinone biosynthesis C-methylase UbiE
MTDWKPSADYQKIAEANREYYALTAAQYESSETCVTDSVVQAALEHDIDEIVAQLGGAAAQLRALDACGGAGNISIKLLKRGMQVTLADISPDLQAIFRRKCAEQGFQARTFLGEIGAFLAQPGDKFDLITFSSALHHLADIDGVLNLAFSRLAPGGLVFTVFDPTRRDNHRVLTRLAMRLEYFGFKAFCQTADVPKAALRRLRRILSHSSADNKSAVELNASTAGLLAEYHVEKGIDDRALVTRMKQVGYEVVWHERYAGTRFKLTQRLIERMGDATAFKLLLRKSKHP